MYLDNFIGADGDHSFAHLIQIQTIHLMHHVYCGNMTGSFLIFQGFIAHRTDADGHFETHERNGQFVGTARCTDCFPAVATVMLTEAHRLRFVYHPEVPEEGFVTLLTGVALSPIGRLQISIPNYNTGRRKQNKFDASKQSRHFFRCNTYEGNHPLRYVLGKM